MQKYRTLLRYARPYRRSFGLILLLTLISSALVALQPWPLKLIVDHLLEEHPLPSWLQSVFDTPSANPLVFLAVLVAAGLLIFASNAACDAALAWKWTRTGRRMVFDLAEDLFARLQQRGLVFHTRNPVGDTMGRIITDSWCVYFVLDTLLIGPAHAVLAIAGMIFLMAQVDGQLTLIALVLAPCMVGASFLVGKPLRAAARLRREIETRLVSHVQQTLAGIPVVQAFVQEEREQGRFRQFADAAIRAQQRSTLIGSINSLSSGLVTTLATGAILWLGARHVLNGTITVGSLLLFLVYLNSLHAQMKIFASAYTVLQGIGASVDRVMEVLETPSEVVEAPSAAPLPAVRGNVRFDHVTFGYEAGCPVLRDIALDVKAGETVAIVGATGAGKSTLINLIPRFFDPWEGRILIDGHDVRSVQLRSLRAQVALVLQEPFLFPMSVAENIAYGRPEASRAEIEAAARAANAHEFIARLPQRYDTIIGERGATLSGGERQRLAIARALLKNAPILVLDEPTSALDAQTEHLLLEALERLMEGRTTFLIAHRLSTIRRADRIVFLKDGQIAEVGTHGELMERGRLYAHLHNIQFEPASRVAQPVS